MNDAILYLVLKGNNEIINEMVPLNPMNKPKAVTSDKIENFLIWPKMNIKPYLFGAA